VVDTLRSEFKKAGIPVTLRAWQARFAGPEAGSIVVTVKVARLFQGGCLFPPW